MTERHPTAALDYDCHTRARPADRPPPFRPFSFWVLQLKGTLQPQALARKKESGQRTPPPEEEGKTVTGQPPVGVPTTRPPTPSSSTPSGAWSPSASAAGTPRRSAASSAEAPGPRPRYVCIGLFKGCGYPTAGGGDRTTRLARSQGQAFSPAPPSPINLHRWRGGGVCSKQPFFVLNLKAGPLGDC